jgi:hypothetical protein
MICILSPGFVGITGLVFFLFIGLPSMSREKDLYNHIKGTSSGVSRRPLVFHELDPAVLCPAFFGPVVGNRSVLAMTGGTEPLCVNAMSSDRCNNGPCPGVRERRVRFWIARVVRMAFDAYREAGIEREQLNDLLDDRIPV